MGVLIRNKSVASSDEVAVLIVCNFLDTNKIRTIEECLKYFPPDRIFIIDHGAESVSENHVSESLDERDLHILNYMYVPTIDPLLALHHGCLAARDFDCILLVDTDAGARPTSLYLGLRHLCHGNSEPSSLALPFRHLLRTGSRYGKRFRGRLLTSARHRHNHYTKDSSGFELWDRQKLLAHLQVDKSIRTKLPSP